MYGFGLVWSPHVREFLTGIRSGTNTRSQKMENIMAKKKPSAVVICYEGTIASVTWRKEYALRNDWEQYYALAEFDPLVPEILALIERAVAAETKIIMVSMRPQESIPHLQAWCRAHYVPCDEAFGFYPGPPFRHEDDVKKTMLTRFKSQYEIRAILESSPRAIEMWRAEGYNCTGVSDPGLERTAVAKLSEIGELCGHKIGANDTTCNKVKGHAGNCAWLTTKQTTPPVTTAPPLALPPPADGATVLKEMSDICSRQAGTLVCLKPAKHSGGCTFVPPSPAPTPMDDIDWSMGYPGYV